MPYFLPKLDMVAIPDFAFGAMENYGLVTICERNLIYDNQHSAAANKQRVICKL
jgi:puromycin-sensitive aminopeptidase